MFSRRPLLLVAVAFCLSHAIFGQSEIESFTDRSSFGSAIGDQKVLDFEGVAPNSGFRFFKQEGQFSTGGVTFRPGGGARFGPGHITIIGGMHYAGPALETTSGAKLTWQPPNQPGNAFLDITLPGGTTAVGMDLWAIQPYTSPIEVIVNTSDGSRTVTISTPARPAAAFVGFASSSPITSLRITLAKGQTGIVIDNLSTGRYRRTGSSVSRPDAQPVEKREQTSSQSQPISTIEQPRTNSQSRPTPVNDQPRTSSGANSTGSIAYVRGTEIRLISPDGSNDRRLWTHPDLREELGMYGLAWRPDGKELAFSSSHEAVASFYLADIYTIRPDGSGLRKLTNPPSITELSRFRKGSVTVTVRNTQSASGTSGSFIVYVAGADQPQQVTLLAGTAKTLVFSSVADFGNHPQPIIAMFGRSRWFIPGTDVQAGRNVTAPDFNIGGEGLDLFGAFRPVWRYDGSRVSYRSGLCIVSSVSVNPTPGEYSFNPLFGGKTPLGTCAWDWGPTAETADQLIYSENGSGSSSIFRIKEGGTHPGTKLTTFSDLDYQLVSDLHWLPDASGLIYSNREYVKEAADIFRYDFATKKVTQVTDLRNDFAHSFSISPDGRSLVFERCKERAENKDCDLWIANTDGGGLRLLVRNGTTPAWGR